MNNGNNGLTRFVESVSFDNRFIKAASNDELVESLSKVPAKLKESINNCGCNKGWWVPISVASDVRRNGNGRIYGKKLWENVVYNQTDSYKQCPMLADHPSGDSDGNPKDICGVWLDAKFGEPYGVNGDRVVYGLLVPSGSLGRDLQDHLQNGLKVGTSTSGFGKLMRDGVTVDPDTYQIERLADWVLNPSASVWFSYDENNGIEDRSIIESLENNNEEIEESLNNNIKEKVVKDSKFTKLEEKKFRRDMESFLESANNISDPQERLEEFKEIKSYLEEGACPDLKEKVEAKIVEQEAEIKKMLEESVTLKEELGIESTKDLKEKLTKIVEDTKLAEKEAKDWKAISEQLQEKLTEANKTLEERPTVEFTEFQKNKIDSLTEQMNEHDSKAEELVKNLAEAYKKIKESCDAMEEQIKGLEAEKADLQKQVESECGSKEAAEKAKAELEEKCGELEKGLKESQEKVEKYKDLFTKQRAKFEEAVADLKGLKTLNEKAQNKVNSLAKEAKTAQMKIREEALKKVQEQRNNLTETERYYEELYKEYGNEVREYKEAIAGARSLAEAKRFFFKNVLQNLGESVKIREMRKPSMIYSMNEAKSDEELKCSLEENAVDRLPKGWK